MTYSFRALMPNEAPDALAIYEELKGTPLCTWCDDYPNAEIVLEDAEANALFGLFEDERLVAAAACLQDEELTELPFWPASDKRPCELSRLGVEIRSQHRGLARLLLARVEAEAKNRGFDAVRLLASRQNAPAIALYESEGYRRLGETHMYDADWDCYHKAL